MFQVTGVLTVSAYTSHLPE